MKKQCSQKKFEKRISLEMQKENDFLKTDVVVSRPRQRSL